MVILTTQVHIKGLDFEYNVKFYIMIQYTYVCKKLFMFTQLYFLNKFGEKET